MQILKNFLEQLGRVSHELLIAGALLFFFLSGSYLEYSPSIQTLALKVTLVSLGFLHATIINKLAFPSIDWANADADKTDKLRATAIYAVVIYGYCLGG